MLRRIVIVIGLLFVAAAWLMPAYAVDDQNCEDFDSQAAAQQHLRNDPSDPDQLDPDSDGVACSVTAYTNTARDTNPVRQASGTATTVSGVTTTTMVTLPTTVASTGAFSIPVFAAGMVMVGFGLSMRGKRAEGNHFTS